MRARIDIALGPYWGGIAHALDAIAAITALGAIGGMPVLINAVANAARTLRDKAHAR
jgi:hypothetical protein